MRIPDRKPDAYTVGMPQVLFSPIPDTGNYAQYVDHVALANALYGNTDDSGYVKNSRGNSVGTVSEIMENYYIGSLSEASLGGDVETLEHTVSNMGYEELDRIVTLDRPYEYSLTFDEPDAKNMNRFIVAQETNLGASTKMITAAGVVFQGSGTDTVTVVDRKIGDPAGAMDAIISLWYSETGGESAPPNGTYAFVIGGTNEDECVGEWANKRQWVAYADFDFGAKTVGAWSYIRPHGTSVGGVYTGSTLVPINGALVSIPDSEPIVTKCGGNIGWNAESLIAWTGLGWYGADPGFFDYSIVNTRRAFKRCRGAAVVATNTEIGTSTVHVIPNATLMPDGDFSFSMDDWVTGSFTLRVLRDTSAVFADRKPALPVPFGYMQTFRHLSSS